MNPTIKKYLIYLLMSLPIIGIATCNIYVNTKQENSVIEKPEPDDYFVFQGLIGNGDQPFKIKQILNKEIEFYVPKYEMINFKLNKSENSIYELDKQGKLYDFTTIIINKKTIDSLVNNSNLSVRINNRPTVYLKGAFGRDRGDAVTSFLKKITGEVK